MGDTDQTMTEKPTDYDGFPTDDSGEADLRAYEPRESNSTLLPRPLASLISAATATSSLGLRIGGFIGNAAISGARIGTLTTFELGRVVIEGILGRAASDVSGSEGLLERVLSTLHYSITSTSFLISTGFQIGSTSLSSGLAVSQFFLSGLDAILGDTETSKAVATIVVLVQREFENPETGISGEKIGLGDLLVGTTAFALLQRWGRKKTDQELQKANVTTLVWDVVVVRDGQQGKELPYAAAEEEEAVSEVAGGRHAPHRAVSFVSATGDQEPFEAVGDGASFISTGSSRAFSYTGGSLARPAEEAFRQRLATNLRPGSSVKLSAESSTTDTVTAEVKGDPDAHVEPPPGFELIAVERGNNHNGSTTFVFQRKSKRRRHGQFDVEDRSSAETDDVEDMDPESFPPPLKRRASNEDQKETSFGKVEEWDDRGATEEALQDHSEVPVTANQKRQRTPMVTYPGPDSTTMFVDHRSKVGLDHSPLRKAMSKTKSVRNLVEFWSRERHKQSGNNAKLAVLSTMNNAYPVTNTMPPRPSPWEEMKSTNGDDIPALSMIDHSSKFLPEPRPTSSASHRRHRSRTYSMTSIASDNSLILKPLTREDDLEDPTPSLFRHGELAGQFPRNKFAANAARFARFALASYGSNFLRLTGTYTGMELTSIDQTHLPEHHSFSTYTNLPPSTVLLSSYVDTQAVPHSNGDADSGLPLVHYVSLDHACKSVVLTCRGTLGFEDILTDMTCDYTNITFLSKTYQVHKGIYGSAKRLFESHGGRVLSTIKAALEEFDDYSLILCGHSLGGAVAAMLAILLANRNTTSAGGASRFVTGISHNQESDSELFFLPPNRPIHAYAYGPAACVSPELQYATKGLVTSFIQGNDIVPFLSLGTLRDFQAMSLAFKIDRDVAKAEVRKRVWDGLVDAFKTKSGLGTSGFGFTQDWLGEYAQLEEEEDHWAWSALKSLRASFLAEKLVPPGDVYLAESATVLQRHAFVSPSAPPKRKHERGSQPPAAVEVQEEVEGRQSFKPATHVTLRYVRDVEKRFGEIRFSAGMFADHFPARYLKVLEDLEKAVGS